MEPTEIYPGTKCNVPLCFLFAFSLIRMCASILSVQHATVPVVEYLKVCVHGCMCAFSTYGAFMFTPCIHALAVRAYGFVFFYSFLFFFPLD